MLPYHLLMSLLEGKTTRLMDLCLRVCPMAHTWPQYLLARAITLNCKQEEVILFIGTIKSSTD